ncbi:MAG: ATP-binding protein [Planctomycetaceae bacterium]|nr:ATP-binding protein [Planctomycetaceae bacterium]
MSGYRSLKRVLGETHLERKVRWLFGICVGGLIFLAFWWVDGIAEDLIERNAHAKGHDLARIAIYTLHWIEFENNPESKPLTEKLSHILAQETTPPRIMKATGQSGLSPKGTMLWAPENEFEIALMQRMRAAAEKRAREVPPAPGPASAGGLGSGGPALTTTVRAPVFESFPAPEAEKFYYYEVVQWQNFCEVCHEQMHGTANAESAASYEGSVFDSATTPFRVVHVTMPYTETRDAINWTRAILSTVGLITIVLAMFALYYVVKYIVVKPLTHLRDVSEAVSMGDLAQRAELHTGDEFEDLAASFNKMLRNLVEAQGELRSANQKLDGKVDELARLNMQLHEMNRLKGEFLANMSHELRTPLNSIIGFSEVLQNIEGLTDKQRRYAQNIQKSGRNLLDMINDILDLAKMEAGKMEVRLSEFRIESLIHAQCDWVRSLAEDKNIDLDVDIASDLPLLFQDQPKVQQILTNLLSNAIKFTPEGGRITVGARGDSRGRIEFWVSDTGVGIPDAEKEIIFEKFRQGKAVLGQDTLTREYSGTGLGLSIVKELCKLLGGEVSVESELGKGSTFRVVIPWMRADQPVASTKLSAKLDEIARPRKSEEPEATAAR